MGLREKIARWVNLATVMIGMVLTEMGVSGQVELVFGAAEK